MFKSIILVVTIILFSGCGSDSTSETNSSITSETNSLSDMLRSNEFFAIEDSIQTKNIYKITFDENLTSWNIDIYDKNYSLAPVNSVTNKIEVTQNTIINDGGYEYELTGDNTDFIDLVSTISPLQSLKLFKSAELAQAYYDIKLNDELKAKEFYVVQNDLETRTLFKIDFNEDASQWDIISYDKNYDGTILGSAMGLDINVTDKSLTDTNGASFWYNSTENGYIRIVSYGNSLITLKFFESAELAQVYYDSFDLRAAFRDKTFYVVSDDTENKQLLKVEINEDLSEWQFDSYLNDYNETAQSSGSSTIVVTENLLQETNSSILKFSTKTDDYIELKSLSNKLVNFRFYNSSSSAESYFKQ